MTPRRRQRIAVAAWLGIVALAIQALIPALLAAEIQLADAEGRHSSFALCAFGHIHATADHDEGGGNGTSHHDAATGTCPICIALLASPPFTAPDLVVLPAPVGYPLDALVAAARQGRRALAAAAYRSRAPPLG